jgi:hypothetical protein
MTLMNKSSFLIVFTLPACKYKDGQDTANKKLYKDFIIPTTLIAGGSSFWVHNLMLIFSRRARPPLVKVFTMA